MVDGTLNPKELGLGRKEMIVSKNMANGAPRQSRPPRTLFCFKPLLVTLARMVT